MSEPLHTQTITATIELVNGYLGALFSRKIQAAREMNPRYEALWREMERIAGFGKRLRPWMVMQAYSAYASAQHKGSADISRVVPAAAACELLHISMLIHDDVIDRDLVRHGEPTIQAAFIKRYSAEVADDDHREHNALSAAILAGDLLLSEARSLMTKCDADPELIAQAGYAFDQSVFEVAGGELLDVESANAPRGSVSSLSIMTYKTASYSFIGPLTIGATLAGASREARAAIRSFGLNLGIAYQLTDDILGIFGDTATTGKPNDGDIHEGKATYLVERFYALGSGAQIEEFDALYGVGSTGAKGCARVRSLLESTGALSDTEQLIRRHADRARSDLQSFELDAAALEPFYQLIDISIRRSS